MGFPTSGDFFLFPSGLATIYLTLLPTLASLYAEAAKKCGYHVYKVGYTVDKINIF